MERELTGQAITPAGITADGGHDLAADCTHLWRIETPEGATSMGVCSRCNSNHEFQNSRDDLEWEELRRKAYQGGLGKLIARQLALEGRVTEVILRLSHSELSL